jgi:hypothetical protein
VLQDELHERSEGHHHYGAEEPDEQSHSDTVSVSDSGQSHAPDTQPHTHEHPPGTPPHQD